MAFPLPVLLTKKNTRSIDKTIQYNIVRGSGIGPTGDVDLRDRSSSSGTTGTANTWTGNKFRTCNPVGLD